MTHIKSMICRAWHSNMHESYADQRVIYFQKLFLCISWSYVNCIIILNNNFCVYSLCFWGKIYGKATHVVSFGWAHTKKGISTFDAILRHSKIFVMQVKTLFCCKRYAYNSFTFNKISIYVHLISL